MPNTVIESLGVYLPTHSLSTEDVVQACRKQLIFPLEKLTGIKSRRVVGEGEFSIDLAKKAIDACLAHSKYQPLDIDILICANCSRYDGPKFQFSFEPSTSVKLRKHFGFDNAFVFDIANACAGMFTAIYIVDTFVKAGLARRGMIVSGEYITHLTYTAQQEIEGMFDPRLACLTLGDAGAALIIERSSRDKIGFQDIEMYTLGQYCSYCLAKPTDREHGGAIMFSAMTKLAAIAIKQSITHALYRLQRMQISLDAFQHIIPHQTSKMHLDKVTRDISRLHNEHVGPDEKIVYDLAERGNTASTSHFVALNDAIHAKRIVSGDRVIFSITSAGLVIGTALYAFDDLPDRLRHLDVNKQKSQDVITERRNASTLATHTPRVKIESLGTIPETLNVKRDSVELASIAIERCLERSLYSRDGINMLIYAGVYRNDFVSEPAVASMVMHRVEINEQLQSQELKKTFAFDIFNGAIGFLNACCVGIGMIQTKRCHTVMIVASEIENNAEVFSNELRGIQEAGSAIILERSADGDIGFGNFHFRYFPNHIDSFTSYTRQAEGKTYLHFGKDPSIQTYYTQCITETVKEFLTIEHLDHSQISIIFPPQISSSFISHLSKAMQVRRKIFIDVAHEGKDLFTSSLAFALQYAYKQQLIKEGNIGLFISIGTGIQVGCALYYF